MIGHSGKYRGVRVGLGLCAGVCLLVGACQLKPDRLVSDGGAADHAKDYADRVVLSELRERAITEIQGASRDPQADVRANAVEAALRAQARLVQVFESGLTDENLGVRAVAAMAVGRGGLKQLAPAVEPLLSDPSPFVRAAAILGLSGCHVEVDPGPLAAMLLQDPSPKVRAHAAFVLGELGNRSALGLLRQGSVEGMPRASAIEVRLMHLQISEALVKLGDNDSLQPLRAALYPARPEDLEATALAVQIIGQVKDRGAIDQLIYLAATKDRTGQPVTAEVRMAIAASLARMGLAQGAFIADEYWSSPSPALRAQAASVYGELGDRRNLGKLETLLDDPDPRVKVSASAAVLQLLDGGGAGGQ